MERRLFLTGMLGVAGAVAFTSLAGPGSAVAGVPNSNGILDELDKPDPAVFEGDDQTELEQVSHRYWHHRHYHGRRGRPRLEKGLPSVLAPWPALCPLLAQARLGRHLALAG